MAEVYFKVTVDDAGGVTKIDALAGKFETAGKKAKEAHESVNLFSMATKELHGILEELGGSLGKAGDLILKLGPAGLAAAAGIGAIVEATHLAIEAVEHWAEAAHHLEVLSIKTQVGTSALQEMGLAAKVSGTDVDSVAGMMDKLDKAIEKGSPAIGKLGLDLEKLKTESPEQAFHDVAEAIAETQNPIERIGLSMEVFGKQGAAMLPFIENMRDMSRVATEMGIVLDEKDVAAAASLKKATTELDAAWEGVKNQFAAGVLGGTDLSKVVEAMAPAVRALGEEFRHWGDVVNGAFKSVADSPSLKFLLWARDKIDHTQFSDFQQYNTRGSADDVSWLEGKHDKHAQKPALKDIEELGDDKAGAHYNHEAEEAARKQEAALKKAEAAARAYEKALHDAMSGDAAGFSKAFGEILGIDADQTKRLADAQAASLSPLDSVLQKNQDVYQATLDKIDAYMVDASMLAVLNPAEAEHFGALTQAADAARAKAAGVRDANDAMAEEKDHLEQLATSAQQVKKDGEDFMRSWIEHLKELAAAHALHIGNIVKAFDEVSQALSGVVSLLGALGASADSVESKLASFGSSLASGIGSLVKTLGDPKADLFSKIMSGVSLAETAISGIIGLFHKPEYEKAMNEVGRDWGVAISEGTGKAIEATENSANVSRQMAELLNLDKIMEDAGGDPAQFIGKIQDLFNAVALGAVPAKDGIEELGKAFDALKTAADGGSVASEGAMIQMIERARQLNQSIPQIDAAVKAMLQSAVTGLEAFYGGQKQGAGGAAQGAANQQIFGAVFQAQSAQLGVMGAVQSMQKALDAMIAALPKGSHLTGAAAQAQHLSHLLKDEGFAGAATAAKGAADALKGLEDSANMSQATLDAFGTSAQTLYDQAKGAKGATEKDALTAILPLLTQLQHAQELGAKLNPQELALLQKAQDAGLLPMKTLGEQQLDVAKQIRDNTARLAGGGGAGGYGGSYADGLSPSIARSDGWLKYHRGEEIGITPANTVSGGGSYSRGTSIGSVNLVVHGSGLNPQQMRDAVAGALIDVARGNQGGAVSRWTQYQGAR